MLILHPQSISVQVFIILTYHHHLWHDVELNPQGILGSTLSFTFIGLRLADFSPRRMSIKPSVGSRNHAPSILISPHIPPFPLCPWPSCHFMMMSCFSSLPMFSWNAHSLPELTLALIIKVSIYFANSSHDYLCRNVPPRVTTFVSSFLQHLSLSLIIYLPPVWN